MHTRSKLRALLGQSATGVIERELIPVDRIMERWAASNGSGLPSDVWDDNRKARPPPLDDETAMLVDELVRHAPRKYRRVIVAWYVRPLPTREIAREMRMSKRLLEMTWTLALNYLRDRFVQAHNRTLDRLLSVRDLQTS